MGEAGTLLGAITGYYGGWMDNVVMRMCDMILSFPSVLLALILISLLGTGRYNIILALGILFIPMFLAGKNIDKHTKIIPNENLVTA